jgi:hypothetical protein
MGLMRRVENRIERTFEGMFGRSSKKLLQPPELAAKLVKEMEGTKRASISRMYVANVYLVFLCPEDRASLGSIEPGLAEELTEHLETHARSAGYALIGPMVVRFETDPKLKVGRFGIRAESGAQLGLAPGAAAVSGVETPLRRTFPIGPDSPDPSAPAWLSGRAAEPPSAQPGVAGEAGPLDALLPAGEAGDAAEGGEAQAAESDGHPAEPAADLAALVAEGAAGAAAAPAPESGAATPPRAAGPRATPAETQSIPASVARDLGLARQVVILSNGSRRQEFHKTRVVLGRSRECDFPVDDLNVSRRHVAVYWETGTAFVKDLDSTNGTLLNGRPVTSGQLADGDVLTLGGTDITVELG